MLSEAWNAATKEFSEDWPSTTVHQIQGAQITLSVSYNQKDWGAMQEWISACSTWHSKADSASAAATPPVAEAAVSPRHYPMPRTMLVATQRGHWEP